MQERFNDMSNEAAIEANKAKMAVRICRVVKKYAHANLV